MKKDYDIVVIGAGPAGLMAAIEASAGGADTAVIEAGSKPGRKLLATGGGRCNVTLEGTRDDLLKGFDTKAGRFLKAALYQFAPEDTVAFMKNHGIALKTERGGRIFPESNRAGEILSLLLRLVQKNGAELLSGEPVQKIATEKGRFIVNLPGQHVRTKAVIIATGGLSMKRSGSTGDGYRFARDLGHTVTAPRPSLIPLKTKEQWPGALAGLALKNVSLAIFLNGKKISRFGEMLFTHTGIGGPVTLELSRFLADHLYEKKRNIPAEIDCKPALNEKKLDNRLLREIDGNPKRNLLNMLKSLLPSALAVAFTEIFKLDGNKKSAEITKRDRETIRNGLKSLKLTVTAAEDIEKALVTRGGVNLKEISPNMMQSKLRPGLFFAGEVIDADGDCGGYNLQMCWSTGKLAGKSAAEYVKGIVS